MNCGSQLPIPAITAAAQVGRKPSGSKAAADAGVVGDDVSHLVQAEPRFSTHVR